MCMQVHRLDVRTYSDTDVIHNYVVLEILQLNNILCCAHYLSWNILTYAEGMGM